MDLLDDTANGQGWATALPQLYPPGSGLFPQWCTQLTSLTELPENTDTGLEHSDWMDEPEGRHIVIRAGAELLAERIKNKMPHNPKVLPKQRVTSNQARWRCSQLNPKVALNLPLILDRAHLSILVKRSSKTKQICLF